jgi:hypothetical protein
MKKTIYNVAVLMESQETCDRMKQLCIDNGLPYWKDELAFILMLNNENYFHASKHEQIFAVFCTNLQNKTLVTESEFIELLKEHKL